ncbi:MAG: stage V sporulation protein AB [Lachnospiraceae bacterium]|nr:stage V sporulation protein AB [Lachnospiraceae bacterium]
MFLRQALLCFVGLSAGSVIAAGIFAFLAIIGVFPRLIGNTHTTGHIFLYETLMIVGGIWGNVMDLYHVQMPVGGPFVLAVYGVSIGVFVGCLVMSLAETLKALPVLNRRIRLSVGIQYVVLAIAAGKLLGALLYFMKGFGGS